MAIATPDIVGPIKNGGIGTAYSELADALASAGHEVTILYTLGTFCENGSIDHWIQVYSKRGIRLVPLPQSPAPPAFFGPRESFDAYRWLAPRDFDVIHFPEWRGVGFCSVQARRLGLAFPNTVLCVGVHSPTLWHDLEDLRMIDRPEQLERDFLERRSVEFADVVVSPSQYLLRWLDAWDWRTPVRTYVHPYISTPMAPRVLSAGRQPVEELVFFGRLESRKGVEIFCDALERLTGSAAKVPVTFLGKNGRAAGIEGVSYVRSRASHWERRWTILSDLSRAEAVAYLTGRAVLAVMPSLADNTPNTVLECLSAGVPFIAFKTGGISEMIRSEDHERVLVDAEIESLATALAERIELGGLAAQPTLNPGAVRDRWIRWHAEQVVQPAAAGVPRLAETNGSPLVSVCLATHDRPEFLSQAIESLECQTYKHFEVLLVDDGSQTPAAQAQLDALEPTFLARGWKVLRRPRRFPGAARNTAAQYARGEFLLFMDDDNVAVQEEIATFVRAASTSGAPILTCAHDGFSSDHPPDRVEDRTHRWLPLGDALPLGLFENRVGDTNMLIRRETFFTLGGFEEEPGAGLFEDWVLLSKAMVRGVRIEVVPEVLYLYRLGKHGFGQSSPKINSYRRPLQPFVDLLPAGVGLALLYASGMHQATIRQGAMDPVHTPAATPSELGRSGRLRDRLHAVLVAAAGPRVEGDAGDHLASRFEAATTVAALSPKSGGPLTPLHQVELHAAIDGVLLRSLGDEPQVLLGLGRPYMTGPLLLQFDISSEHDTVVQVFWRTPGLPVFTESQSVRTKLHPGRNVSYLRIPSRHVVGRIRLDPSTVAGDVTLHSLEIRRERHIA